MTHDRFSGPTEDLKLAVAEWASAGLSPIEIAAVLMTQAKGQMTSSEGIAGWLHLLTIHMQFANQQHVLPMQVRLQQLGAQ